MISTLHKWYYQIKKKMSFFKKKIYSEIKISYLYHFQLFYLILIIAFSES